MLNNIDHYSDFIYSLPDKFFEITAARIDLFTIGQNLLKITGIIYFPDGIELRFQERINIEAARYQNEVPKNEQRIYYYDPQPPPNDPDLASTFPHHKQVPSDIKHHRKPAHNISFDQPNLPVEIQEIVDTVIRHQKSSSGR